MNTRQTTTPEAGSSDKQVAATLFRIKDKISAKLIEEIIGILELYRSIDLHDENLLLLMVYKIVPSVGKTPCTGNVFADRLEYIDRNSFRLYMSDTNRNIDWSLPPKRDVEATLGYDNQWRDFGWSSSFTFSWNKNKVIELVHNYVHPETGELITKDRLEIKGMGKAKYILKPGGTMGDLYTNSDLKYNDKGKIDVDEAGNVTTLDTYPDIYLGSVLPKYNMAWRNDFRYKGVNLGFMISARIGGIVYSATQAWMDQFGVSEDTALARDAGGVLVADRYMVDPQRWYTTISAQSGLPQYYTYSATNVRLQELSLGYTFPKKWFRNVCSLNVSFVGRNLWMIYCKAPFDPESVATTDTFYQGIDYFMMPALRNIGFNVKLTF